MCDEKAPSANREEIDCAQVAIDLLHAAERELGSFVSAVRELFSAEQVPQAIEDWMQELIAIDWPRQNAAPDWRCVSITAALRLSRRSEVRTVYKRRTTPGKHFGLFQAGAYLPRPSDSAMKYRDHEERRTLR